MKNNLCLLYVLIFSILLLAGCGQKAEHCRMSGKAPGFETLEEMENYCDLIVRATRLEGEEPIATMTGDQLLSGHTFSSVEIIEIFKDSTGTFAVVRKSPCSKTRST